MLSKLARLRYVFNTLVKYGLLALIGKKLSARKILFDRLMSLGGMYVKFLQLIVLNEDATAYDLSMFKDALTVYDQVEYENLNIRQLLADELGEKAESINIESTTPFAAGSFAQVYGGSVAGRPVVIKALRPSVTKYLKFDLKVLSFAVRVVSAMQLTSMFDLVSAFEDLRCITLQEVDYRKEVNNAVEIAQKLKNHAVIYIPQTYPDLSSNEIIVQERIEGVALTELFSWNLADKVSYLKQTIGTDLNYVMEELAVQLLEGSLDNNGTHADPHPGNIYLMPGNRIVLIDFGIKAAVQKHQPELLRLIGQYVDLYKGEFNPIRFSQAMISYYIPSLTQSIATLSTYLDRQELVSQILGEIGQSAAQTLTDQSGDPAVTSMLEQYRMTNLFMEVINKNNRFGFRINIETPAFVRSTQIFMQIIRRVGCDIQLLRRAWERVLTEKQEMQLVNAVAYDNISIDNSLHEVASWLDRLCYSDPNLYNRVMKRWGEAI